MMFEQVLSLGKQNKFLILIFAVLIIIGYFAYENYKSSQECGDKPCVFDLNNKLGQKYGDPKVCGGQICHFDLEREWKDTGCSYALNQSSLIYSVHITNAADGSVENFTCEFGPMYSIVPDSPMKIQNCSKETAELIDLAVKGRNTTYVPYVRLLSAFPDTFNNYTYTIMICDKYKSGRFAGKYLPLAFLNYSGYTYP